LTVMISAAKPPLSPTCSTGPHERSEPAHHLRASLVNIVATEPPFGTLKAWMGSTHFLTRTLEKVKTEMSLQVLAYNMKRMINIFGVNPPMQAIAA
jgi:hypothetical protein